MNYYRLDLGDCEYVVKSEKTIDVFANQDWLIVRGLSALNMKYVKRIFEITMECYERSENKCVEVVL